MDKITELFKELKERISNPFIYSFLIAWLVFNWRIIIGVLFYNINDLQLDGYSSYVNLIEKQIDTRNSFWHPLLIAIGWTFLFPPIRNGILAFNTWNKAWGNKWNLNISKPGVVSMSKYIELRGAYEKRTKLLEDIIKKESKYINETEELRTEKFKLIQEKNEAIDLMNKAAGVSNNWEKFNDVSILNGEWDFTFESNSISQTKKLYINNGHIAEIINPAMDKEGIYRIVNHFCNISKKEISIILEPIRKGAIKPLRSELLQFEKINIQILKYSDGFNYLEGVEDNFSNVTYTKVSII